MTRWVGRGIALLVLAGLVLIPAIRWPSFSGTETDTATINSYVADYTVAKDGRIVVTETLRVSFPDFKHGIFRFFDVQDPGDSHVRLVPRDIQVARDGQAEPFEVLHEGKGRYLNVKIGSPSFTMTGEHTYVIRYAIPDALGSTSDGKADFYWNLIGAGWRMPIQASRLTVHLPAKAGSVKCAIGQGATGGCSARPTSDGFVVRTGALEVNTPVTVRTTLAMAAPERDRLPWPQRFDPVFGSSVVALVLLLVVAAFAALMGELAARGTREPKPAYPLMYAPPDGIGPAQAKYLFTETIGKDAFVASIMQTAEKGATTLDHSDGWTITDTGQAAGWQQLDPVSAYAAQVLGVPGGSFTADPSSVSAGKKLKSALSKFDDSVRSWARQNGLMAPAGLGSFGGILVVLAILLTLFLCIINPLDLSVLALVPGLFAVFAIELLRPGAGTKRTAAGRDLWSRIGGFRRILSTLSAEDRFDFSGRKELYTAYIPWAVAFGVADQWAEKYRIETGEEPPVPTYVGTGYGYSGGSFASDMANDLSSTVSSAISAYNATQTSSSSGGGGGFSGGGGGGGGGGGSW